MLNLEKVEIGGIRGASLSAQVVALHEEFIELHKQMSEIAYDALDPEDNQFNEDYLKFKERLLDMDRRLGSILCQAFDDCYGVEQMFKLMAIAGTLIERPVIKDRDQRTFVTQGPSTFILTLTHFWTVHFRRPSILCRLGQSTLTQDCPLLMLLTAHFHPVGPSTITSTHTDNEQREQFTLCEQHEQRTPVRWTLLRGTVRESLI